VDAVEERGGLDKHREVEDNQYGCSQTEKQDADHWHLDVGEQVEDPRGSAIGRECAKCS